MCPLASIHPHNHQVKRTEGQDTPKQAKNAIPKVKSFPIVKFWKNKKPGLLWLSNPRICSDGLSGGEREISLYLKCFNLYQAFRPFFNRNPNKSWLNKADG